MSYFSFKPGELRYAIEAHGSYCAAIAAPATYWEVPGGGGSAVYLRCFDPKTDGLEYQTIDDAAAVYRSHAERGVIPTVRVGKVGASVYLTGSGTGTPAIGALIESALGNVDSTLIAAAPAGQAVSGDLSTTTVVDIPAGTAANIPVGSIVRVGAFGDTRAGGECRVVVARNTVADPNTITLHMALSAAPTASGGDKVYGGFTYYLDEGAIGDADDSDYESLAVLVRHRDRTFQCRGAKGGFKIRDLAPGKVPMLDFEWGVGAWDLLNTVSVTIPTIATAASDARVISAAAPLFLEEVGTTTRAAMHVADITVDPGLDYQAQPSPWSEQGVAAMVCNGSKSRVTVRPYADLYDFATHSWYQRFADAEAVHGLFQMGHTAQRIACLYWPNAYIEKLPARGDANGVATREVALRLDEGSVTTNELTRSKLRIALL